MIIAHDTKASRDIYVWGIHGIAAIFILRYGSEVGIIGNL